MLRFPTIAALLLVAGCGQQSDPSPAQSNDATPAPVAEAAPATPTLDGEWHATMVDGRPFDQGSRVVATFEAGKVRVLAGCTRRAWTFTQKRNIVSFAADPAGSSNCESLPSAAQETGFQAMAAISPSRGASHCRTAGDRGCGA
jgi:hypothetical protein